MSRRLPPLSWLRAFEATARHLSFTRAAEELNVTPSALSHHVRQLEEHLGTEVFLRKSREIALTETGARLLPFMTDGLDRLAEGFAQLDPDTPDNILVVSTGPAFAAKWLAPRMSRFVDRHPEIEIRIAASLKLVDFVADQVDAGIRFGAGNYPGLHIEWLADDFLTPMVSPDLLPEGRPFDADDLRRLPLLHDDSLESFPGVGEWSEWLKAAGITGIDTSRGPRFSHADHALDAAADGAGAALGRVVLAGRDLARGRLVAPFDLRLPTGLSFCFVCPPTARGRPKVEAFREWLLEEVGEMRAEAAKAAEA